MKTITGEGGHALRDDYTRRLIEQGRSTIHESSQGTPEEEPEKQKPDAPRGRRRKP